MRSLFLVLVGLSFVLGPAYPRAAVIAIFLIVLGLGFIARGFARRG